MPSTIVKLEGGHSIHLKGHRIHEVARRFKEAREASTSDPYLWFDGPAGEPNAICIDRFTAVALINPARANESRVR